MSEGFLEKVMRAVENGKIPDRLVRFGIRRLLKERLQTTMRGGAEAQEDACKSSAKKREKAPSPSSPTKPTSSTMKSPPSFFIKC